MTVSHVPHLNGVNTNQVFDSTRTVVLPLSVLVRWLFPPLNSLQP